MLLPLPPQPPALQSQAPANYDIAEAALLDALDLGRPPRPVRSLQGEDRRTYAWLLAAASWRSGPLPSPPFPAGTPAAEESRGLLRWLSSPSPDPSALKTLPLAQPGSRLLLWRWMKAREGNGRSLPGQLRRSIEDRLLERGPGLLRGWALRHALCFALAERDVDRFSSLRRDRATEAREMMTSFQALFALLDGPSPVFRLWRLPDLDYRDTTFGDLGARRVWIAPAELQPKDRSLAWILPSESGELGAREGALKGKVKAEAEGLAPRIRALGRTAWFAPSAAEWEPQGLSFFPILLELDAHGAITSIRMGDAAPAKP